MSTPPPLMKCGHTANAVQRMPDGSTRPTCVICAMGRPGEDAVTIETAVPDMTGRRARCHYHKAGNDACPKTRHGGGCCGKGAPADWAKGELVDQDGTIPTALDLPFLELKGGTAEDPDSYYCGCWGWD